MLSYEEELEYLRREFKKSEDKFHEAEREGWHTDANIYKDNMENFEYQIHIHEQATKADEYEAKAKAFDHIENLVKTELTSDDLYNDARNNDYAAGMLRVYEMVDYIIDDYESGDYDV